MTYSLLHVEDTEIIRWVVSDNLGKAFPNLVLYEAVNGAEGLEHCLRGPVDIVVTDKNMPIMDGSQFLAELKKAYLEQGRALPVLVMMSTHYKPEDASKIGVDYCVPKINSIDPLIEMIGKILQRLDAKREKK